MITDIQKKWINDIVDGHITKADNPRKYSAYMRRIQERIDHMLDNLEWLVKNSPDIIRYEEREFDDPAIERHIRLKRLLRVCAIINPISEDPAILKIIGKLISPQFGIEIFKKSIVVPKPLSIFECQKCHRHFEPTEIQDGGCPYCESKNYVTL